ncbi:hypothetical protein ACQPZG_31770 [Streptomyces sp. CA-294286]|uniref:hypothetical protein n=1 Tax=Streptomyces sp. CA-294286 TaxID=3240070 RepID=UPI003D89E01E
MTDSTPIEIEFPAGDVTFTVLASVHDMQYRQEPEPLGGFREGLYARLETSLRSDHRPTVRHMSRLLGEHHWYIDGEVNFNGYIHHNNGFGVRYLRVSGIVAELETFLNQQAAALGLATDVSSSAPLRLASAEAPQHTTPTTPPRRGPSPRTGIR